MIATTVPLDDAVPAWLRLGFRPFFLAASVAAVLLVGYWWQAWSLQWLPTPSNLPPSYWHGHEMIFGYAGAVIAGFLLTAVKNWTGIQTPHGNRLLLLLLPWAAARLFLLLPDDRFLLLAALLDCSFWLGLSITISGPVWQRRQWQQMPILGKVYLLGLSNLLFYAGVAGWVADGGRSGLYSGLYLVLALIFTMGRRVIPFFIEKGVGYPLQLTNRRWLDIVSMLLFLALWALDTLQRGLDWIPWVSGALFLLHCLRLYDWHTPGIWHRPMLWVLYGGYAAIVAGFALRALTPWLPAAGMLSLHALAYAGIGLVTLGMMARVTLGHTGRDVTRPPTALQWLFAGLILGAVARVLLPLIGASNTAIWLGMAFAIWILVFALFLWFFAPMLLTARVDGNYG